jgi:hypothetical protein
MRKIFIIAIFIVGILLGGCQTVRGIGGAFRGLGRDTRSIWRGLKKANAWMRENAW